MSDRLAEDGRRRSVEKARNATPAERAAALLEEIPEHPLVKLARELEGYIWEQDRSRPRPNLERQVWWCVENWLSDSRHNRADLNGNRETVDAARADAYRLLAERDAQDADWYVRQVETRYDSPQPVQAKPVAAAVQATEVPNVQPQEVSVRPLPTAELNSRADLLLSLDPLLSNLATHSDEMKHQILVAITNELRQVGYADALFLKGLYEASRPKALSKFPPRM